MKIPSIHRLTIISLLVVTILGSAVVIGLKRRAEKQQVKADYEAQESTQLDAGAFDDEFDFAPIKEELVSEPLPPDDEAKTNEVTKAESDQPVLPEPEVVKKVEPPVTENAVAKVQPEPTPLPTPEPKAPAPVPAVPSAKDPVVVAEDAPPAPEDPPMIIPAPAPIIEPVPLRESKNQVSDAKVASGQAEKKVVEKKPLTTVSRQAQPASEKPTTMPAARVEKKVPAPTQQLKPNDKAVVAAPPLHVLMVPLKTPRNGAILRSQFFITPEEMNACRKARQLPAIPHSSEEKAGLATHAEAIDFVAWLTSSHRQSGRISAKQSYRLPLSTENKMENAWSQDSHPQAANETKVFGIVLTVGD